MWRTAVTLLGTNLPVSRLFGFVFGRSSRFPVDQAVIEAYGAPFPSRLFRGGAARWGQILSSLLRRHYSASLLQVAAAGAYVEG